jgi:quinol monooxygenase YgiN
MAIERIKASKGDSDVADGYGTIYRMRIKPGAEAELVALLEEWERERKPKVPGAIGGYLFKPDNRAGELVGVAVFRDQESFRANASDPGQDAWYRRLRGHLDADPEWEDGVILGGFSEGGRL